MKDENGDILAQYTHTPGGKLKEIRHGNGMYTQYEYDTDGNIIHLRLERADGRSLSDWKYEYDLNGNRTLKAGSFTDAEDKLCNTVIGYQYDKMDRLIEEVYDGESVGYSYDLCGNRLERVDKKGKEVYNYNVKNQLVSRKSAKAETFYKYDRQGNVYEATGTKGGMHYSYNAFNQQIKVQKSDGSSLESQYDAEYLRARTVENGKVSEFLYYNGELLSELNQEQEITGRYVLGYGVVVGWNHKDAGYHFYHQDEQNSTAYITGTEREVENYYQYDAFGVIRNCQERFANRILFTGQQYDPITEQYYLRARYYNPTVGRFLQEDVYHGDGLNLYAYCRNNPVIYYDPSGFASDVIEEILEKFNEISSDQEILGTNNSWNSFTEIVAKFNKSMGEDRYSPNDIQDAYHRLVDNSEDGHYIKRYHIRESTKKEIPKYVYKLDENGETVKISMKEAKKLGLKIDIGHQTEYEFWRTRNAAESLGWTQTQYNDFMNTKGKDKYKYEEHSLNISHKDEQHSGDITKLQKKMKKYQQTQIKKNNPIWTSSDNKKKPEKCESS